MTQTFCVLQTNDRPYDIQEAGRVIAEILHEPAIDVRQRLVEASGILWDGLGETTAQQIAEALTAKGIGAVAREEEALRQPGPRTAIKFGQVTEGGFLILPPAVERLVPWKDLLMMTCARVKGEAMEIKVKTGVRSVATGTRLTGYRSLGPSTATIQDRAPTRTLLDLFAANPEATYRIDMATFKYFHAGSPVGTSTYESLKNLAQALLGLAPHLVTNLGVDVLLEKGGNWQEATFDSLEEFDRHNLWMLQLVS